MFSRSEISSTLIGKISSSKRRSYADNALFILLMLVISAFNSISIVVVIFVPSIIGSGDFWRYIKLSWVIKTSSLLFLRLHFCAFISANDCSVLLFTLFTRLVRLSTQHFLGSV